MKKFLFGAYTVVIFSNYVLAYHSRINVFLIFNLNDDEILLYDGMGKYGLITPEFLERMYYDEEDGREDEDLSYFYLEDMVVCNRLTISVLKDIARKSMSYLAFTFRENGYGIAFSRGGGSYLVKNGLFGEVMSVFSYLSNILSYSAWKLDEIRGDEPPENIISLPIDISSYIKDALRYM